MRPNLIKPVFTDNYKIMWVTTLGTCVGHVINYYDKQTAYYIDIEMSDLDVDRTGYTICAHTWIRTESNLIPKIGVTQYFMSYPKNVQEGLIWHEVGHIHYYHVLNNKLKQHELQNLRGKYIESNDVLPMEVEADVFAAKKIGKQAYIDVLKFVKDHRPFESTNLYSAIGKKEYDLRVQKISDLISD